jgi:hypothetical protein
MATQTHVATTSGRARPELLQTIARAVLMILGLVLLWAGHHAVNNMNQQRARTFVAPWGGWLWSLALLVLAGAVFGLAAMLPAHAGYRPMRALLLGAIPLVMLLYMTIDLGPAAGFVHQHLRFLVSGFGRGQFFFEEGDGLSAVPVLLGVAIAAGFAPGG